MTSQTIPVDPFDLACPSECKVLAPLPASSAADVELAVKSAYSAFYEGPWSRTPAV